MIRQNTKIEDLHKLSQNTIGSALGIEFTEIGLDFICGKMPVDNRTRQPAGILHGGASVVLAETLGSIGSYLIVESTQYGVGLEINANHIRSVKEGYVFGKAQIIHCGRKTHVWEIKITNESGALVCISRLTVAVLEKNTGDKA